MINHVRTLLLNRTALPSGQGDELEEFIEPGFRQVTLPSAVSAMHAVVMPLSLDRRTANAYVLSYMQLMHRPDFQPYLTDLDSRLTYSVETEALFDLRRRTGAPAVPDYVMMLRRLVDSHMASSGALLKAGKRAGKDELVYSWLSGDNGMHQLTAGLYLLTYCIEEAR